MNSIQNNKLVFSFLGNAALGITLEAFLVKVLEDGSFSYDYQRVVAERMADYDYAFSEQEQEVVRFISEVHPHHIEKIFNRKKLKREVFFEKLPANEELQKAITAYCDRRIAGALALLKGSKVYWREKASDHPALISYNVHSESLKSTYYFTKVNDGIKYQLILKDNEEVLPLFQTNTRVLCSAPGWIAHEKGIFSLSDETEGQKIIPFLKKEQIEIPDRLADNFISAFLIKATRKADVRFEGFDLLEEAKQRKTLLHIAPDLEHKPVLHLMFQYDNFTVDENNTQEILAQVKRIGDKQIIVRLQRDLIWEAEKEKLLHKRGLTHIKPSWFLPKNKAAELETIMNWLAENKKVLTENGFELDTTWQNQTFAVSLPVVVTKEMRKDADWFDLHAVVRIDSLEIPFIRFKRNILNRDPRFKLPDGRIIFLPEAWFIKYADLFEFSEESNDRIRIHRQHQGLLNGHALLTGAINSRLKDEQKKIYTGETWQSYPAPARLNAQLRDYQKKGFDWLCSMSENRLGACLADDMGLGKTLQVIALLQHIKEQQLIAVADERMRGTQLDLFDEHNMPSLIVMAPSLIHNWERELGRFAPDLIVKKHSGYRRTSNLTDLSGADVILTTYGVVRNDLDMLMAIDFHYVILDESQLIKNMRSMSFQSVKKLHATNRIVLTGTPVENSLSDLWSQLTFLQPGLLGSHTFFRQEFVIPIEQQKDEQKLQRLQKLIRPFILRRTKEEVAPELPAQTRKLNHSEMSVEQARIYEEQKSYYRNKILDNISREGIQKSQILILRGLTQLRKIAIHPVLFDANYTGESAKFNDALLKLKELMVENRKVLIFSQFVRHLDLFRKAFIQENMPFSWLSGEVPQHQRSGVISEFEETIGFRAFLIQLRTGGSGLNLTQADCVFLLDPWWNPAAEEQAIARSHRIGQNQQVFVWKFITKDTIEDKIMRLQDQKSRLASDIIGKSNPIARLSQEDLEELFS
ncbi:MAG: DEAD/DEAH box helicase [Bacteroidia bacterium]